MLHDPNIHYLDNAATTMVNPEVIETITKAMAEHWANPSSLYTPGAHSELALNKARADVARTLGATAGEGDFTGCGGEQPGHSGRGPHPQVGQAHCVHRL